MLDKSVSPVENREKLAKNTLVKSTLSAPFESSKLGTDKHTNTHTHKVSILYPRAHARRVLMKSVD